MPIEYDVDVATGLIRSRGFGGVGDEDLLEYVIGVHDLPDYEPWRDEILDLRDVEVVAVTSDGIRRTALAMEGFDPTLEGARVAIVVASDLVYGLARMYEMSRESSPDELRVFRDPDEAERWVRKREPAAGG